MSKEQRLADIHAQAKRRFDIVHTALRHEREQCLSDRRFYSIAGAQWEDALGEQFANKPKFEVNKVHLAVIRIINEYRNNRITVKFTSKDGSKNDELADTCNGLYRADEQDSCAEEAYDNAFEEAVGGGFGAWRLRACYEDEEDDEKDYQRIKMEPIYDADMSVFFDLDAKRQDKSDAKFCFVLSSMTHEAFREEYDQEPSSWDSDSIQNGLFEWCRPDVVYVAEYYQIEHVKDEIHVYQLIDGTEERHSKEQLDDDASILDRLIATGAKEVSVKKIKRAKVHKYIMSGSGVLEDCGFIAGRCIPIIPVYGKRWFINNLERCMGHVRLCKDAQRLKNMQLSKLGEISALSAVEKPIFTAKQIVGHEHLWAEDNIRNNPFLTINEITDAAGNEVPSGPVGYTKPPTVPPAMAALLQLSEQDMRDVLGNQEQGEKIVSNISAEAVDLVQTQLGLQSYIYVSNMAKAIQRSGAVWLSMASELYVEDGRKMKTIGSQDEIDTIEIAKPMVSADSTVELTNDLSKAKFDVVVDVGPTSSSKKSSIVKTLSNMLPLVTDPSDQQVLGSMIMLNMEGEGIAEVRNYYRQKLLRMGVLEPTDEEAEQMAKEAQNQKPDAQSEYLQAAAQEAQAKAVKAQADTELTLAKSEETKAKTVELLARLSLDERKAVFEMVSNLNQQTASAQPMSEESNHV